MADIDVDSINTNMAAVAHSLKDLNDVLRATMTEKGISETKIKKMSKKKQRSEGIVIDRVGVLSDSFDDLTTSIKKTLRWSTLINAPLAGIAGSFGAVSGTFGAVKDLGGVVLTTSGEIGELAPQVMDLGKQIPIVGMAFEALGPAVTLLSTFLQNSVDSFRNLANSGASFNGSLLELRRVAAGAGLSIQEFSKVVTENSARMAMFGENVGMGARRFSSVTKVIRDTFGTELMNLGLVMEEVSEFTQGYMFQQAQLGRLDKQTKEQIALGTFEYVKQLDKLAKLTGKDRKEIEKGMEARRAETEWRLYLNSAKPGSEELKRREEIGTLLEGAGQVMDQGIRAYLSSNGSMADTMTQALHAMIPGAIALADQFRNGEISAKQFAQGLSKSSDSAIKNNDRLLKISNDAGIGGLFGEFKSSVPDLQDWSARLKKANEGPTPEENLSSILLNLSIMFKKLQSDLLGSLLTPDNLKAINDFSEMLAKEMKTPNGRIHKAIDEFVKWAEQAGTRLKEFVTNIFGRRGHPGVDGPASLSIRLETELTSLFKDIKNSEFVTFMEGQMKDLGTWILQSIKDVWDSFDWSLLKIFNGSGGFSKAKSPGEIEAAKLKSAESAAEISNWVVPGGPLGNNTFGYKPPILNQRDQFKNGQSEQSLTTTATTPAGNSQQGFRSEDETLSTIATQNATMLRLQIDNNRIQKQLLSATQNN